MAGLCYQRTITIATTAIATTCTDITIASKRLTLSWGVSVSPQSYDRSESGTCNLVSVAVNERGQ